MNSWSGTLNVYQLEYQRTRSKQKHFIEFFNIKVMSTNEGWGKKKKRGYKMPAKIPTGDVLTDSSKQQWVVQSSIGCGGFGEIYTATAAESKNNKDYVIKIEPSENGPLFCEKTVYLRIGKPEDVQEYLKARGLKSIGMPAFFGCGIHSVNGKKLRFLVMERYGKDLWTIFLNNNKIFPAATVYKIANQVLDVLEYIHSKGYVHSDIKGANLLLGKNKGNENKVFLIDFGLASKYTNQYKPDPKRAHNGTIEYTSRDGHEGIVTRRGDIEMLGFNMLHWLSSCLPWDNIRGLAEVQEKKNKCLNDVKGLMQICFKKKTAPRGIQKYFEHLLKIEPLAEPDYNKLRGMLKDELVTLGDVSSKLDFSVDKAASKPKSKTRGSPVPAKKRKGNDETKRKSRSSSSVSVTDKTINISDSSSDDDFIETTPEKKTTLKRSWKDCPSVVACAEVSLQNDKSLRRTKRNK